LAAGFAVGEGDAVGAVYSGEEDVVDRKTAIGEGVDVELIVSW